jgi:hypothetical protein
MNHVPVESSNIKSVGYDPEAKLLEIQFANGGRYQYADVSPEQHQALVTAPSVGSHFAKHILKAFTGTKV